MKSRLFIVIMRSHSSYVCLVNLLGLKVVLWVVPGLGCGVVEKDGTVLYLIVGSTPSYLSPPPHTQNLVPPKRTTFTPSRLTSQM
jgi:hypothetical protein